jgi:hypothetical protein
MRVRGDVAAEVAALDRALARVVPAKSPGNLLIGTWNVRAFDRVSPVWRSASGASPIRDLSNVAAIAEIVRRFDVVAVQEVRRSAQAFLAMMTVLGPDWAYLVTDVTDGRAGNSERLAFVFDTTRLRPSGLACELVVAASDNAAVAPDVVTSQFARTLCRQLRPGRIPLHPGHAACRVRAGASGPECGTGRYRAMAGPVVAQR